MKKLVKFSMAVVALFAVSCTTDATEDLGVQLGGDGQTTITLSLEESRTQLGEKADGVYPLYWSESDAIAVNGVASKALTAEQAGSAYAAFTFGSAVTRPFNVVYPAPATGVEAVTENCYPVVFPASQLYKAGNIPTKSTPMYGYGEAAAEGEEAPIVQMQHLTGVLRLAIKGDSVVLRNIAITAEKGNIAGTFDVNCQTGELIAQEGASNTVVVTFSQGLVLSADEATPIYVTVPAGDYGKFTIRVNSTEGVMKLTFDSTDKPIQRGVVREFAEFTYATNAKDSDVFIIDSKDALLQFAEVAPNFYPYIEAKVTAPIDMTDVAWTPIEGFGEFVFDGGNNEIKGLSAPLFGTTSASIKNLKLTSVNIEETVEPRVGAFARVLHRGSLYNCSASGTLKMNNNTYNEALISDDGENIAIGGLVGYCYGANFTKCKNQVAVTVSSVCLPETTISYPTSIGGVVGYAEVSCLFDDCINDAKVLYNGESGPKGRLSMAGVIGRIARNSDLYVVRKLENTANGVIEMAGVCGGELWLRGVVATLYDKMVIVEDIVNRAAVTFTGTSGSITRISGAVGNLGGSSVPASRIKNYGAVSCSGTISAGAVYVAGLSTETAGSVEHYIEDCHNYGSVKFDGTSSFNQESMIAGLIASNTNGYVMMANCSNSGSVYTSAKSDYFYMGGIVAKLQSRYKFTGCTNSGAVECAGENDANVVIGGFSGNANISTSTGTYINCTSSGSVKFTGTMTNSTRNLFIGGFVGYVPTQTGMISFTGCTHSGSVLANGKCSSSTRNGGFVGGIYGPLTFTSCLNSGSVTSNILNTSGAKCNILTSGFVGDSQHDNAKVVFVAADASQNITPCKNTGTITITGHMGGTTYYGRVSGIANVDYGKGTLTANDVINEGQIVAKNLKGSSNGGYIQVGGVTGCHIAGSKWVNVVNKGEILVENVTVKYALVGGISGHTNAAGLYEGTLINVGDIKVRNCTFSEPETTKIGGIVGSGMFAISGAKAYCNIEAKDYANVGWIMGTARGTTPFAVNCEIGGTFVEEWDDTDIPPIPKGEALTRDNYFNYIYGGTTDWTGVTGYDGCKLLETKPNI